MSTEIAVLRALLRLSRRSGPATLEALVASVREDAREVQTALATLARQQLVLRTGETTRLTMSGLAVAVAAAAQSRASAKVATRRTGGSVVPLQLRARRHRAA
jgi:RIO-like serine/threonine protein kinase